jgi:uncharacterized protein (TIGR03083 family)
VNLALDYLGHLAHDSARFGDVLRGAPSDAPVPSCPDWAADDLLWHLGEVQWFWGTIVREKFTDGSRAEKLKPPRPGDRAELLAFYAGASRGLQENLAVVTPDTHVWTWSDDQTVGFIRRRQAHEALMHRVDAELITGDRSPMDPLLSSDGVDEALRIMYGAVPAWGRFAPRSGKTIRLLATDTDDSWIVRLGRLTGTDPDEDAPVDELAIEIADADDGGDAAATVAGNAADLDCWLWRRPTVSTLDLSGDEEMLDRFESTIAAGID